MRQHATFRLSAPRSAIAVAALLVTLVSSTSPAHAAPRSSGAAKVALAHRLRTDHARTDTTRRADSEFPAIVRAVARRHFSVLVAHTRTAGEVSEVAATARRDGMTVRHSLGVLRAVSVRVPRAHVGSAARRLLHVPGVSGVEVARYRALSAVPNDPDYSLQSGYLDAIHAPAAWDRQHGSSDNTIAVIDTGADTSHPDLSSKIAGSYNARTGTSDVTDTDGHGTFVAGIAAAATDNAVGIAGMGYDTDLLIVKVADSTNLVTSDDEAAGIVWAADHGAKVVNVSLAGAQSSPVEQDAVAYAQSNGALVVGAAGNDGTSMPTYPAAYPNVVAVGATDAAGHRAGFSNHGSWITLAAPGVGIHSTAPVAGSTLFPGSTTGYGTLDGTSLAAPLVSGAAALLFAQQPGLSASAARQALVDSASGYVGQDLGAGQLDAEAALDQLPPTTRPGPITPGGTAGAIVFTTTSTADSVAFAVDGGAYPTPSTVADGVATFRYASWGHTNGVHTISAVDCTNSGGCSASPTARTFTINNPAPRITAPANGAHITGGFAISASATGGGVRFLIDGVLRGFDGSAPYSFHYTGSALSEGRHALQTRGCSADQTVCNGPLSTATTITSDSLHPSITGLGPAPFSPNGDHVKDTTTLTYRLPDTEHVLISVYDAAGNKVRGPSDFGTRTAGTYTWTWDGHTGHGIHLPSGTYLVRVSTDRSVNGATVRGMVGRHVQIDLSAPKLYSTTGGGATFYPVTDGYRDSFMPGTTLSEAAHLTIQFRAPSGAVVRTMTEYHHAGRVSFTWYGRDNAGDHVPPGTYRWSFTATDKAGNVRHGTLYRVYLSGKHLVKKSAIVRKNGDGFAVAGGSDSCADADTGSSYYEHGVELINTCGAFEEYDQIAIAVYKFGLPAAARYDRLKVRIGGFLFYSPSELFAAFYRADSDYVDIPSLLTLTGQGEGESYLASGSGEHHVNSNHVTEIGVAVDGYGADVSDFDLKWVQVTVDYEVLQ